MPSPQSLDPFTGNLVLDVIIWYDKLLFVGWRRDMLNLLDVVIFVGAEAILRF